MVWSPRRRRRRPPSLLAREVNAALARPDLRAALAERGVEVSITPSPQDFGAFLAKERAKWGQVIRETGATAD